MPTWTCRPQGGVASRLAEVLLDDLVARLVDQRRLARRRPGCRPEPISRAPASATAAPQLGQLLERLAGVAADPGLQLDLLAKISVETRSRCGAVDRLQHLSAAATSPQSRVDQEQLLLDPERERRRGAEAVLAAPRSPLVGLDEVPIGVGRATPAPDLLNPFLSWPDAVQEAGSRAAGTGLPAALRRPHDLADRRRDRPGRARLRDPRPDRLGDRPRHRPRRPQPGADRALVLVGGVVADRISPRLAMLGADAVRTVSMGLIAALLLTGAAEIWELALLYAIDGAATAFFNPASNAIVPQIVPGRPPAGGKRAAQLLALAGQGRGPGAGRGPAGARLARLRPRRRRRHLRCQRRLPAGHPGAAARPDGEPATSSPSCATAGASSRAAAGMVAIVVSAVVSNAIFFPRLPGARARRSPTNPSAAPAPGR